MIPVHIRFGIVWGESVTAVQWIGKHTDRLRLNWNYKLLVGWRVAEEVSLPAIQKGGFRIGENLGNFKLFIVRHRHVACAKHLNSRFRRADMEMFLREVGIVGQNRESSYTAAAEKAEVESVSHLQGAEAHRSLAFVANDNNVLRLSAQMLYPLGAGPNQ